MPRFRVRSVERDRETDGERLSRIQRAVATERQNAVRELAGLGRRQEHELALLSVGFAEMEDYGQRSTDDERSLEKAEAVAMRAMARSSELEPQISWFDAMLEGIDMRLRASPKAV